MSSLYDARWNQRIVTLLEYIAIDRDLYEVQLIFKGKLKMKKLAKHFKGRGIVIEVFNFRWRNNDIGLK